MISETHDSVDVWGFDVGQTLVLPGPGRAVLWLVRRPAHDRVDKGDTHAQRVIRGRADDGFADPTANVDPDREPEV